MFIPIRIITVAILLLACLTTGLAQTQQQTLPNLPARFALPANPIELRRASRPNVYFDAVGRKSAIFGHESGVFESWVFPMKLFHDARISIRVEGQDTPVDFAANVERIITRPESTTLIAQGNMLKGDDNDWKLTEVAFPASNNNEAYQTGMLELALKESGKSRDTGKKKL